MANSDIDIETEKQERLICFGAKNYNFRETRYYYDNLFLNSTDEKWDEIKNGNPHFDIMEMCVYVNYDNETKEFYNHCTGMKSNFAGDMFWDAAQTLEVLRCNNVPESKIPDFILNYKDIERRFLEGDTSTYKNAKNYPTYCHTIQQLFSDLPDLVDF